MRKFLLLALLNLFASQIAVAYCNRMPRLICAEYANSDAVVTARLLQIRHVAPTDKQDWFIYTLEVTKLIKGQIDSQFRVYEENTSGRAPFVWKKGESYLLFLSPVDKSTWWLYGCGNSDLLRKSVRTLEVIESLGKRDGGLIQGSVRSRQGSGLPRVRVAIVSEASSYKTTTDRDGMFRLHVPAGRYKVRVLLKGWSLQRDTLDSYENPGDVDIENGWCAQVAFFGDQKP